MKLFSVYMKYRGKWQCWLKIEATDKNQAEAIIFSVNPPYRFRIEELS